MTNAKSLPAFHGRGRYVAYSNGELVTVWANRPGGTIRAAQKINGLTLNEVLAQIRWEPVTQWSEGASIAAIVQEMEPPTRPCEGKSIIGTPCGVALDDTPRSGRRRKYHSAACAATTGRYEAKVKRHAAAAREADAERAARAAETPRAPHNADDEGTAARKPASRTRSSRSGMTAALNPTRTGTGAGIAALLGGKP